MRGLGIAEGTGDIIAELNPSPVGEPVEPHYYLANHRGDTILVLNSGGAVENYFCYDAFGNQTHMQNETGFKPKYTFSTKEFLPSAELYLYAYRVYDPISGRWTQRDPIDYEDSINLYNFCGNNPIIIIDEWGLKRVVIVVGPLGNNPFNWRRNSILRRMADNAKLAFEKAGWDVESLPEKGRSKVIMAT